MLSKARRNVHGLPTIGVFHSNISANCVLNYNCSSNYAIVFMGLCSYVTCIILFMIVYNSVMILYIIMHCRMYVYV